MSALLTYLVPACNFRQAFGPIANEMDVPDGISDFS
jgi:hypothetical protein